MFDSPPKKKIRCDPDLGSIRQSPLVPPTGKAEDGSMASTVRGETKIDETSDYGSEYEENDAEEEEEDGNELGDFGMGDFDELPTERNKGFNCLTEDEIFAAQQGEIARVSEILSVPASAAGALLRHFRWNQESLISKYLEDPVKALSEAGLALDASGQVLDDAAPAPAGADSPSCLICYDEDASIRNACGHGFCQHCWKQYLSMKIEEGEAKNISCPAFKCKCKVSESTIQSVVDAPIFAKFKSFLARSFVDDNPNVRWCPAPNCGRAIRTNTIISKSRVLCECGYKFCFSCNLEAHPPAACHQVKLWFQKCKDDSETYNWLSANTQDCPICKSAIEKNGGCNHMTCKQCKHEFCWVCQGDWKSHNDYYSCNRYDKSKEGGKEKSKEKSKAALDRYLHYYHRYINHENSLKLESNLREKADAKMNQLQNSDDSATWIDVQYVQRATEQLLECRSVLKYTYVFSFYLDNGAEKNLFEYLQEDLEKTTEKLSEMLEAEVEKISKGDVMNTTRMAALRLNHLLQGVERGLTSNI